jgi:hypothetical protein
MKRFTLTFGLITGLCFLGIPASAEPSGLIDVIRSQEGVTSLTGPSCQELTQQERFLRLWTLNVGETPGPASVAVENADHSLCSLVINNSVPSIVHLLQDFKTTFSGPNCWNTTLRLSRLIQLSRFSSAEEMSFWMTSPYCRELSKTEKPLPGDIIAIRGEKPNQPGAFDEIHGMIYLSDDLVFSKNTSSSMSPYGIQRANLVYQIFRTADPKCTKVQGRPEDCYRWVNHYRCTSSEKDQLDLEKENSDFSSLSGELKEIESQLSEYVMNGQGNYDNNKEVIQKRLTDIEGKTLKLPKTPGKASFFAKALLQKINSLKVQTVILSKQPPR